MTKFLLAAVPMLVVSASASAALIRDFDASNSGGTSAGTSGAGAYALSSSVGSSATLGSTTVSGITGNSFFTTIDTSGVPASQANDFGPFIQINNTDVVAGDFSSSDIGDYSVVFDTVANGFSVGNATVFIGFFDAAGGRVGGQGNIGGSALSAFRTGTETDSAFSTSIPLSAFGGGFDAAAFEEGVDDIVQIQVQYNLKSLIANYGSDTNNILVLDNVGIVVPEPASAVLLGLGGTLLLARRRNRG